MKNKYFFLLGCLFLIVSSCKQKSTSTNAFKFIETSYMDSTVRAGDNFFLFVNGRWLKNANIKPTESSTGAVRELYNRTRKKVRDILEESAHGKYVTGSLEQKVGDFYASGMDSLTIEKLGYEPVKPILQKIDNIRNANDIMQFEADMHKDGYSCLVSTVVYPDQKNSSINILNFAQTGLGLPDRDYYFKTDVATLNIQKAYQAYIKKIFMLIGDDSVSASKKVKNIYALEKQMAASHRTNVELRDPRSNYHKVAVKDLDAKMAAFGWTKFMSNLGATSDSINVGQLEYYSLVNTLLKKVPIDTWKAYLKFNFLSQTAPALSSSFVSARFDYVGRALRGQEKDNPRWERIYWATDNYLDDVLGQLYVKKYFTEDAKTRMLLLINNLQKAFEKRIEALDWMTDSTKQIAKNKLSAFLKKIGYPEKWKDFNSVVINRNSYFENILACNRNQYQFELKKIDNPVDKTEWEMSPPTINAYYNPTINEIVFPAGILQFPFFDANADDAINYGGIGTVIGHEMTHGFDDEGSQYDKDGNLKNWWGKKDREKFVSKSKYVIDLYNTFTVVDSLHINGALTTGENMADIGGVAIAYDAFKMTDQGKDTTRIDGFTPDQRFFIAVAQIYRDKTRDAAMRQRIHTDPHSPAMYRVNGPLMNFTPFYDAFNVKPGNKMYLPESDRIKIW